MRQIELLAPAKNIDCGFAAINHGADAVYIGAPKFGARKMAGNSLSHISDLVAYAHIFNCKVYVTINTIIYDHELNDVEKLIHDLYNINVDAIIIQDMGILEMNLPPIAIHASTQTDNRSLEKIKFLEDIGFEQVVLARELSLKQIEHISKHSNIKLECFIHGALCVSYSGQCYLSASINNRSANRGECGQPCRLPYTLYDNNGKTLVKNKYLLSLKDLNLSEYIDKLIDAGINSFKIEGRLKDADYVKNITSHYRQLIDKILIKKNNIKRSSIGNSIINFIPEPHKSFSRNFTSYFINGRQDEIWNIDSPKALGERIGRIVKTYNDYFTIEKNTPSFSNGDGICFFDKKKNLKGTNINKVIQNNIYPESMNDLYAGAIIFRNRDNQFNTVLKTSDPKRLINVDLFFKQINKSLFELTIIDEEGVQSSISSELYYEQARNKELANENTKYQLSKLGNSNLSLQNINIKLIDDCFFQSKVLNNLRRDAIQLHISKRIEKNKPIPKPIIQTNTPYFSNQLNYKANIANKNAFSFYKKHGVNNIEMAFEISTQKPNQELMRTKYCILDMLNKCNKNATDNNKIHHLILSNQYGNYECNFDCKKCEMTLIKK
ncbi:MAG: U32 family peptidase [Marinilabiliaceae bacterium]|nr:U32 family peptidase [Marinilabiliaceae bacterium]